MAGNANIKNETFTTESGTNVRDTKMLKGQAREGTDWNSKNETKEYEAPNPPTSGPLGGRNASR